jgi:signal transduction histidine kinase/DNA-binding response OmpR family regulator/HAMP domain-containing protein
MNLFKWFSNLNINAKLSFSYFFIVAMVVSMSYVALSDIERLQNRAEQVANKQFAGLKLLTHIAEAYPLTLTRTRDAIFASQANQRSLFREEIFFLEKQIDTWSRELDSKLETKDERVLFERYEKALNTFRKKRAEVLSIDNKDAEAEAALTKALYGDLQASSDDLKNAIDDLIKKKEEVAEEKQAQNQETVREAYRLLLSLAALTVLVIFLMWLVIKGYVSRPIEELEKSAAAVALGDLEVRIKEDRNDEIGKLSKSFNQIVKSLAQIVNQANAISEGDFAIAITPRSEKDQLAIALTRMTSSLCDQYYLKDGLTRLNALLSGHYSTEEISERIISFLGEFLEVGCGVLYVYDEETKRLHLTSSYAFVERDSLRTSFAMKEGIVGQVAHERKPILLKNAQNETEIRITSGTIERKPTYIFAFPLVYENELCGVVELASFEPFTALQRTFLEDATETVASHLYSALQESKMKLLFEMAEAARKEAEEQTKRVEEVNLQLKAEQMRVQQQSEELQQQNEEMQQQAEELQQTNEELQQQQEQLERQRAELEFRNELLLDAQKELEAKAEELQRSSRYKSEFLANMSHELRTPLNSIILLSDMLRRSSTSKTFSERDIQKCQVIYQSGNDLLNLINDILDISKIEAGRMVVNIFHFQTEELTAQLKALFDEVAKQKGLQFHIIDEVRTELVNDRDKLAQVLKNFLSNAFKFTREGSVTLHLTYNPDPHTKAKYPIRIGVKDTGIGIPKDKQKIIFEAFRQVDGSVSREFGGTGLGLSIARELTMMLGGELHLESKENEGSEFYILLPLRNEIKNTSIRDRQIEVNYEPKQSAAQVAAETQGSPPRPASAYRGVVKLSIDDDRETITEDDKVILIVEDNIDYANSLAEITRGAGMKALIATSAKEALSDLEQIVPVGILLDLGLPDMNGSELLELIKQKDELRAIPISIVSARDKNLELFEKGAIGYLQKPIEAWQVREEVMRLAGISSKQEKQMLLVEDDPVQQGFLLEMFNKEAVSCKAVTTEDAAKEELSKGIYDAVIADLNLEKGSGMALSRYIREQRMNIPVIIYTSKDLTPEETSELRLYSVSIIIKNPQSHNQLLDKTKMFLHQVSKETPIKSNKKPLFKPKPVVVVPDPVPPPDPATQNAPDIQPIQVVNEKLEKLLVNETESSNMLSGKRILIVDDDIRNVFVITSALENHEAEIFEALNGQEALDVLKEEDIDLILMDIMMPVMDGYETIKNIRKDERVKHIPIIAVTAKALKEDRDKCIEAGADAYMTKPIDYNLLLKLVREQLEKVQKAKKLH